MDLESLVVSAGFGLLMMGSVIYFLPRRKMCHWAIEAREKIMQRYLNQGEEKMALGISREIAALQTPSSPYPMLCLGLGILLLCVAFFF